MARNKVPEITISIPIDHPAFGSVGGARYEGAVSDLIGRARNARALAAISDPETRRIMIAMQAAESGSCGRHELYRMLQERGVKYFSGMNNMDDAAYDPFWSATP